MKKKGVLLKTDWPVKKLGEVNTLKNQHEETVCKRFLSLYNVTGSNHKFLQLGDPAKNEPDCLCTDNFNIELVGVYDNPNQPERMWQEARGNPYNKPHNVKLMTLDNLDDAIAKKLQKLNSKHYKYAGSIILLCNLVSPFIETNQVVNYIQGYTPFRLDNWFAQYFDAIWIIMHKEGSAEHVIYELE